MNFNGSTTRFSSCQNMSRIKGSELDHPATRAKETRTSNTAETTRLDNTQPPSVFQRGIASTAEQVHERNERREQTFGNDGSAHSVGDICRICHMGEYSAVTIVGSLTHLGTLISSCRCRGSVGLVHAACLERWLIESGHTRCEICGHKYVTKKLPKYGIWGGSWTWFRTVVATRQTLFDILYLMVTTPLALFSTYVFEIVFQMVYKSGFKDIPWMLVAMLPTCFLTVLAYWGWLFTLIRIYWRRWQRFWRHNFIVKLLPENEMAISQNFHENTQPNSRREVQMIKDGPVGRGGQSSSYEPPPPPFPPLTITELDEETPID